MIRAWWAVRAFAGNPALGPLGGLIKAEADTSLLARRQSCDEMHDPTMQLQLTRDRIRLRDGIDCPRIWKDMAMTLSFRFVARPAVAIPSIALLLCALSGTAMSQPTPTDNQLPGVTVDAPKQVARPHRPAHHSAARSTTSRPGSAAPTIPASSVSEAAQLAKLATTMGNCVDGCQTSFRYGNAPWHGCSISSGGYSQTCRNAGNFKTYDECKEAGRITGWRTAEASWYCTSLALK
ncbi:hypothetical protein [Bradyrhizobium sp. McL0616]|uniref:hypothetical protein n=1 Tax=Bradyrhizobium sp. McL0616 TaxID=3415674 RepID=UPI003CF64879